VKVEKRCVKCSSINDITTSGRRGYQGFYDNCTETCLLKRLREGVSKIIENPVTSFMDDPLKDNIFCVQVHFHVVNRHTGEVFPKTYVRCQFHQHFTPDFFARKCFVQLFSS